MDGYANNELYKQFEYIQYLSNKQKKLNSELDDIVKEMEMLPQIPKDIDNWIDSISKSDKDFKLSDFCRLFEINKRYNEVIEEKEQNTRTIKILAIDNLISKIDDLLK